MIGRLGQIVRYFGTAGTAAVVDIGGFALLYAAGLSLAPAAAVSFFVATGVNYSLTARFVFGAKATARGYIHFLLAAGVGFLVNVGATLVARDLGLLPVAAKVTGVGLAFFLNFTLNAAFVFRPKAHSAEDSTE